MQIDWLTSDQQQYWRNYVRANDELWGLLSRQFLANSGHTLADYKVLVSLTDVPSGQRRISELAAILNWERSRLSHHLTRMTARGLVEREECVDDGRGIRVRVTQGGRDLIASMAPDHVADVRRFVVDVLTPTELKQLGKISNKIRKAIQDFEASA